MYAQLGGERVESDNPFYALTVAMMRGMELSNQLNAALMQVAHAEGNSLEVGSDVVAVGGGGGLVGLLLFEWKEEGVCECAARLSARRAPSSGPAPLPLQLRAAPIAILHLLF